MATLARGGGAATMRPTFDRALKTLQRSRAAALDPSGRYDYLREEVAERLADRLPDMKRSFRRVLDVGAHAGQLAPALVASHGSIEELTLCDSSAAALHRDTEALARRLERAAAERGGGGEAPRVSRVVCDEEDFLRGTGVEEGNLDAVVSSLSMHWVNDLPGLMVQIRKALRPDGLFLGAMLGGDTLHELRVSLQLAEQDCDGGVSQRVSPFVGVEDAGSLLSRGGFRLLTVDTDHITIPYPSAKELMQDLGRMGEGNAATLRSLGPLPRRTLQKACQNYDELFGDEVDGKRIVPATFQVIYMIGWAPDDSQVAPLARGSAKVGLQDALKEERQSLGAEILDGAANPFADKARPEVFSLSDLAADSGSAVQVTELIDEARPQDAHEEAHQGKPYGAGGADGGGGGGWMPRPAESMPERFAPPKPK